MAALLVLQVVPIVQKPVMIHYSIQFDYTQLNDIMMVIKQMHCIILKQETQLFSSIQLAVPKSRRDEFIYRLKNLRNVELSVLV